MHFRAFKGAKKRDIDELRKEAQDYVEDFWKDVQERAGDDTQRTKEFREQSQRYTEELWRDIMEYTKRLKSVQ